jgi:hypothetical protein
MKLSMEKRFMVKKAEIVVTDEMRSDAESQIRTHQREVEYQTKEFTVELLVQKYLDGISDDENEIFIPAYQRSFVWGQERQSKFIESVMLGLPVPYIFLIPHITHPTLRAGK